MNQRNDDRRLAKLPRRLFVVLSLGVALSAVACAAPDEEFGTGGAMLEQTDLAVGTALVTTTDLNLRSGPGVENAVIVVMPAGSKVTVAAVSGASGWLNVTFNDKTGYASGRYLEKVDEAGASPEAGSYSATRGAKMAARALALWNGHSSRNLCLAGVDDTAESSGALPPGVSWIPRKPSAVAWENYVNANPGELLKRGYQRQERSVNDLPKGSIIGWRAGQCGYHPQYGHIEIVVDDTSSRACSDFCGSVKKNCGNPFVYVPVEL